MAWSGSPQSGVADTTSAPASANAATVAPTVKLPVEEVVLTIVEEIFGIGAFAPHLAERLVHGCASRGQDGPSRRQPGRHLGGARPPRHEITRNESTPSPTYGRDIGASEPIGRLDVVTITTSEGIDLVAKLSTSAIMGKDDYSAVLDAERWFELSHRMVPGSASVDAIAVNRIPDVIVAPPGLVATVDLPSPVHQSSLTTLHD